jgi:DNA-binding transcriptional LysR family regulator
VVVMPGLVYGRGGGLIETFYAAPGREHGAVACIGDGSGHWALVRVEDIAELYALALTAPAGAVYAGVSDQNPTTGQVAEAVSHAIGRPGSVRHLTAEEAHAEMGPIAEAFALDQRLTGARARTRLGWEPAHLDPLRSARRSVGCVEDVPRRGNDVGPRSPHGALLRRGGRGTPLRTGGRTAAHRSARPVPQIKSLEDDLRVRLFARDERATKLSPAGEQFLADARPLPASAEGARRRLLRAAQRTRTFTVGFLPGLTVTAAVREPSRRRPSLNVEVVRTSWNDETEVLHGGRVDVGYVRPPIDRRGLNVRDLLSEARVAVLPADHRLADKGALSVADLAGERLLQDPAAVPEWRTAATVPADPPPAVRTVEEKLEHVAAGHGVLVLPLSTATFYTRPDVTHVDITDIGPTQVCLAWEAGRHSGLIEEFVDIAVRVDAARQFPGTDGVHTRSCSTPTPSRAAWPTGPHPSACRGLELRLGNLLPRVLRPAGVLRLVRLDDLGRDAATVVDRDPVFLGPPADVRGPLTVVRGTAAASGPTAGTADTALARLLHVRREHLAKLVRVFRSEINFVGDPVKRETHRLVGRLAVDVIEEPNDRFLCHVTISCSLSRAGQSSGLASGCAAMNFS